MAGSRASTWLEKVASRRNVAATRERVVTVSHTRYLTASRIDHWSRESIHGV